LSGYGIGERAHRAPPLLYGHVGGGGGRRDSRGEVVSRAASASRHPSLFRSHIAARFAERLKCR